jgi:hypothetical protein
VEWWFLASNPANGWGWLRLCGGGLQALLATPAKVFALVLAPTRELAFGIAEQFEALGSSIGLSTAVIVGGVDMVTQAIALSRKPHVIVGTPGRIVDHLENTKVVMPHAALVLLSQSRELWGQGFSLRSIKFLVMDEADRMLSMDFEEPLDKILQVAFGCFIAASKPEGRFLVISRVAVDRVVLCVCVCVFVRVFVVAEHPPRAHHVPVQCYHDV